MGYGTVLPELWPLNNALIDDSITVSLQEVAAAIKLMAERNRIIAEGAGAIPVAAALSGRYSLRARLRRRLGRQHRQRCTDQDTARRERRARAMK